MGFPSPARWQCTTRCSGSAQEASDGAGCSRARRWQQTVARSGHGDGRAVRGVRGEEASTGIQAVHAIQAACESAGGSPQGSQRPEPWTQGPAAGGRGQTAQRIRRHQAAATAARARPRLSGLRPSACPASCPRASWRTGWQRVEQAAVLGPGSREAAGGGSQRIPRAPRQLAHHGA